MRYNASKQQSVHLEVTMRLLIAILLVFLCLSATLAMLTAQGGQAPGPTVSALTNKDVLDMLGAGLTAEVVIAKIKSAKCNFDTSPNALKTLKAANVPDGVILAMVQAPEAPKPESTQEAVLRTAQITCLSVKEIPMLSAPSVLPQ